MKENGGDLISRSELKKQMAIYFDTSPYFDHIIDVIDSAPTTKKVSVIEFKEPLPLVKAQKIVKALDERPQGKWKCFIYSAYYGVDEYGEPIFRPRKVYQCPECKRRTVIKENFCPNCGADMRDLERESL